MSGLASGARLSLLERLNPILVKEVRQALRGRYFRIMFWLTLSAATVIGLLVVATSASNEDLQFAGQAFFLVIFACLSAAVHAFTPFSAFLSTSSEWDENTHDLLVLSNLRPRQIVLGKLSSALVQALLYYSTFGPFLVFAFLLNGIDLLTIGVLLACSAATCMGLTLIGIALASLAQVKALRGLLMALFGAALAMAWGGSIGIAGELVSSPQELRKLEGQLMVVLYITLALALGALFGAIAAGRFAHEEENRSSGLRLASLGIVFLAGAWGALLHAWFGEHEATYWTQIASVFPLYFLWLLFLTEPEGLGRRTSKHVSPRRWLALVSAPFLPGGGRGMLLLAVHALLALLGARIALAFNSVTPAQTREALAEVLVVYGYAWVLLGFPAWFARFVRTPRGRFHLRLVCLFVTPFVILLPALLGLFFGLKKWMEFEHPLNPAWVLIDLADSPDLEASTVGALALLAIGSLLTLALNARRMGAGLREVLTASRARRQREMRAG